MPVTSFEIRSREPFEGGRAFGDVGAYERIDGVLRYAVDPANESNLGIVDLARAARDEQSRVRFEGDVTLLRPVDPTRGNGRLLCDVVNRGNRTAMRYNLAPADPLHPDVISAGDGYLMERGWTVAFIGWQWDVARGGGRLGLTAPSALNADGKPIEGEVCVTYQPTKLQPQIVLSDRGHEPYTVADLDQPDARLFLRDFPNGTRQLVARNLWRFARVEGDSVVPSNMHVVVEGGFEPGRFYEAIYRTDVCPVVGVGLLAFRDATSFLRYSDDESNPVRGTISRAFGLGISQAGFFLREFLAAGANVDEEGRVVFDGLHLHIAGARRGELNFRRAQPSVHEAYGLGHLPPWAYDDVPDPRNGETIPGLLTRLRARNAVPKLIATNTSSEYWRGDGALMHMDLTGSSDLPEVPEARNYLFSGTQHGPGSLPLRFGAAGEPPTVQNPMNITDYTPLLRGAFENLEQWVCDGIEPPASRVPRFEDKTAKTRDFLAYSFSMLPMIQMVAPKRMWTVPWLDFGAQASEGIGSYPPITPQSNMIPSIVSAVDADGNELAGIRLPDISVPLATHTGWNPRHDATGGLGETAGLSGSSVPFPATKAERERTEDTRLSIEERYRDRDDYLAKVRAAAEGLVADRFLLARDVEVLVANCAARWDALVPAVVA